jgi:p24 family protein alpha
MKSLLSGLVALALAARSQAIYFYIDGTTPKCFYEELPKDTLVVGWSSHPIHP